MRALKILISFAASIFFTAASNAQSIAPKDAEKFIGKSATVCGQVVGAKYLEMGRRPTFLDFEKPFPNAVFSAIIFSEDRSKFGEPEKSCLQKNICVTGEITKFRDQPQIIIKDRSQLKGC